MPPGNDAAELLRLGYVRSVGVPITVAGATWGALVVVLREDETLSMPWSTGSPRSRSWSHSPWRARTRATSSPRRACASSGTFTTARNSGARRALARAPARAGEAARRPGRGARAPDGLSDELSAALVELRELAQGTTRQSSRSVGSRQRWRCSPRAPLAVEVDVDLPERLPEHVETAAYYAVSEALANVVKHASATSASVRVERLDDRVETLDGALSIDSPPGGGTLLRAELPVGLDSFTPVGRDG